MINRVGVLLIILLVITGCKDTGVDTGKFIADPRKPTFENMAVEIAVKTRNDTLITITTSCLPLFNGKGKIILYGAINSNNACYELLSPVQGKFCNSPDSIIYDSLPFNASENFKVDWLIAINKQKNYTFSAKAVFDSIIVQDSCELFVPEYDCKKALEEYRKELKYVPLFAISKNLNLSN